MLWRRKLDFNYYSYYSRFFNKNFRLNTFRSGATKLTAEQRDAISHGATEKDLAHSGLEDSMVEALKQMRKTQGDVLKTFNQKISLRVAAYVCSINKVAKVTQGRGSMMSG